jgi:hypothetical protein
MGARRRRVRRLRTQAKRKTGEKTAASTQVMTDPDDDLLCLGCENDETVSI